MLLVLFVLVGVASTLSWLLPVPEEQTTTLDLYAELRIDRSSSLENIQAAFSTISNVIQTRITRGCSECSVDLQNVQFAVDVLTNSIRRQLYDDYHPRAGLSRANWNGPSPLDPWWKESIENLKTWFSQK